MLAAAVIAATCGTSEAGTREQKNKRQQISPEQQISREELTAKQAMHISERLGLDEETAALFTETYCNFQKELWETAPRPADSAPMLTKKRQPSICRTALPRAGRSWSCAKNTTGYTAGSLHRNRYCRYSRLNAK